MKYGLLDVDKMFSGGLSRTWIVIRGLIVVSIVLLLLSLATTKFEVVVFCLLILVLLHQTGFESLFIYGAYDHNVYMLKQFHFVLKGMNAGDDCCSSLQATIARSEEILRAQQTNQIINYVFYYFLWAVLIWKILSVM